MTFPSFVLGGVLATILGAAFHILRGGSGSRLVLYQILAWLGFWGGQWLAERFGWQFATYGPLHFGLASVSSVLFLIFGHWLSLMQVD